MILSTDLSKLATRPGWFIGSYVEMQLKHKLKNIGEPLKNWNIYINKGLMTGFNEAFYIDKATRDELIENDKNSADIIKPMFRGREINRYYTKHKDELFVLVVSDRTDIEKYPAVKKHLTYYKDQLENRAQYRRGDHSWFTVDNCPSEKMLNLFENIKISRVALHG